jgi:flagella basal body P-ring formation protein FlgA
VVPAGAWTGQVTAPPGVTPLGRVRLELEILVDGTPARTLWATADVSRFGDVVVATRQVARGELLRPGDLALQRLELSALPRSVLTDAAEAAGTVARQTLLAWAPVRREQLGVPALVHRGDAVLLVAQRGALRLSAAGEARHDAGRGEAVAVLNRRSGKTLVGRVLDPGTVAVEF